MDSAALTHFRNGAISGAVGLLLSYPWDTIKIWIQESRAISINLKNLYRGVLPPLLGVGLEKAIVFGTFTNISNSLLNQGYSHSTVNAVAGGLSGISASFIVTPVERLKILLQTGQRNAAYNIKPQYLFRGLSATFTRETPGFAIYFSVYENLKRRNYTSQNKEIPPHMSFMYGGLAGAISWIFIFPQDCIKTKIQAVPNSRATFIQTAQELYKKDGPTVFYRGFSYALMRAIPLHAGTFMTMEYLTKLS